MSDKLTPSEEEERYFQQEQQEARRRTRHEKQLAAIRQQERKDIAAKLNTNEAIAEEALALGFDGATASLLPLVPIIQMAWADGSVSSAEHREVLNLAEQYGIEEGTTAHDFLQLLLDERPTETFFERVNLVIRHMLQDNPEAWTSRNIVELARQVAEASGGFFGLTNRVNHDEAQLLDEFAALFSVESAPAAQIFEGTE